MRLEVSTVPNAITPDAEKLAKAISSLDGTGDSYLILSKEVEGNTYMQACGGGEEGFYVEYQEDNLENHFGSTSQVSEEITIKLFQSYLKEEDEWKDMTEWEKMDLSSPEPPPPSEETVHREIPFPRKETSSGCMGMIIVVLFLIIILNL